MSIWSQCDVSESQGLVDFIQICEEREAERDEDVTQRQVHFMLTFQLCAHGVVDRICVHLSPMPSSLVKLSKMILPMGNTVVNPYWETIVVCMCTYKRLVCFTELTWRSTRLGSLLFLMITKI